MAFHWNDLLFRNILLSFSHESQQSIILTLFQSRRITIRIAFLRLRLRLISTFSSALVGSIRILILNAWITTIKVRPSNCLRILATDTTGVTILIWLVLNSWMVVSSYFSCVSHTRGMNSWSPNCWIFLIFDIRSIWIVVSFSHPRALRVSRFIGIISFDIGGMFRLPLNVTSWDIVRLRLSCSWSYIGILLTSAWNNSGFLFIVILRFWFVTDAPHLTKLNKQYIIPVITFKLAFISFYSKFTVIFFYSTYEPKNRLTVR